MTARKSQLLGVNFGTARARLDRDLIYSFAKALGKLSCLRCGEFVERENFSIDHRANWSVAPDPKAAFFDLENIAFSHHHCNAGHTERQKPAHGSTEYQNGCRCDVCRAGKRNARAAYDPAKREQRYIKYGT